MIIVLLLIVFGFIFYAKWAEGQIKHSASSIREEEAYSVVSLAANLPELHCTRNNIIELNCYDTLKIQEMAELIDGDVQAYYYYNALFKAASIKVYEIYPHGPNRMNHFSHTIYNNTPEIVEQKVPARIPIKLYNPLNEDTRFGVIEVVRYY